jgi:DsbC/DsbD-like thiol-disulfide interchange protein
MKRIRSFLASLFIISGLSAQQHNPVSWQAKYNALSAKEGEIVVTATIEKGWHTYSQKATDAGPIPTSFSFTPNKQYQLNGATQESEAHEEFVPAFDAKIAVFSDKAEFKQKITLKGKTGFSIPFTVEYMSCNDMMCLPPKTVELFVKVP